MHVKPWVSASCATGLSTFEGWPPRSRSKELVSLPYNMVIVTTIEEKKTDTAGTFPPPPTNLPAWPAKVRCGRLPFCEGFLPRTIPAGLPGACTCACGRGACGRMPRPQPHHSCARQLHRVRVRVCAEIFALSLHTQSHTLTSSKKNHSTRCTVS